IGSCILLSDLFDMFGASQHLSVKDAGEIWLIEGVLRIGLDKSCEALVGRSGFAGCFNKEGSNAGCGAFEHGAVQTFFIAEVIMNHSAVDARFLGYITDGGAVDSPLR